MKKFRRSPIAVICYVMAAITAAYFIAVIFSTMSTIHQYYAQYQMSAGFGDHSLHGRFHPGGGQKAESF